MPQEPAPGWWKAIVAGRGGLSAHTSQSRDTLKAAAAYLIDDGSAFGADLPRAQR